MLSKIVPLSEAITGSLYGIPVPEQYQQLVVKHTLDLLGPDYPKLSQEHAPEKLQKYSATEWETLLRLDLLLIENAFQDLYEKAHALTHIIHHSSLEDSFKLMLERVREDLLALADIRILHATEESATKLEETLNTLIKSRGRYKNIFDIRETQNIFQRLNIGNYAELKPQTKTLILLRVFTLGILFQTFTGFEIIQHETCVELSTCSEKEFYTELLPSILTCSLLLHTTLDKSLRLLLNWLEPNTGTAAPKKVTDRV